MDEKEFTSFQLKRLHKFHEKCAGFCNSKKQFDRSFIVSHQHIRAQGLAKNIRRLSLNNELLASVIKNGRLNLKTCDDSYPIEIAVDGIFLNFEWRDLKTFNLIVDPKAQVRVVIREGSPKSIIVTAYVFDKIVNTDLPEVDHEIW